jgi:hypothetical protein
LTATPRKTGNRFSDFVELFKVFGERGGEAVVVGGQAVNLWAELFESEVPEIGEYRPFTSDDLDLYRPDYSIRELLRDVARDVENERDPFGKAFTIVSHTFLVEDKRGKTLAIDSLKMIPGLRSQEVQKGTMLVQFRGVVIRVLNPIVCLKAKLHNVATLDQRDRQDVKHVRILIPCVRAFLGSLLREGLDEGDVRAPLAALNQLRRCAVSRVVRKAAAAHRFDFCKALPLSDLIEAPHPKLINFATRQLPKLQQAFMLDPGL